MRTASRGWSAWLVVVVSVVFVLAPIGGATVVTSPGSFVGPDSVITFETGSTALPSVPGVTLTPYGNSDSTFSKVLFGNQVYGDASTAGGYTDLFSNFSPNITEVGAWGRTFSLGSGPTNLTVNVYGPTSNLLETAQLPTKSGSPSFVGFIEPQGISRIEWLGGNKGFFCVDNITYGGAAVPEPACAAIWLLSLPILLRRRRLLG